MQKYCQPKKFISQITNTNKASIVLARFSSVSKRHLFKAIKTQRRCINSNKQFSNIDMDSCTPYLLVLSSFLKCLANCVSAAVVARKAAWLLSRNHALGGVMVDRYSRSSVCYAMYQLENTTVLQCLLILASSFLLTCDGSFFLQVQGQQCRTLVTIDKTFQCILKYQQLLAQVHFLFNPTATITV